MKAWIKFLGLLLPLSLAPLAQLQANHGEAYTVSLENDTRRLGGPNSDNGYTNGFRFSYLYAEDTVPSWVPFLTNWTPQLQEEFKNSTTNFGISLNQKIYTPEDIKETKLITDDRPYAGWLYVGLSANFKTESRSHTLELDLGVIGPDSLGEEFQNNFHDFIDVDRAYGWKNQLNTEPTVQLSYFQKNRFVDYLDKDAGRMFDIIPYMGASLGNVLIAGHVGVIGRLGINLPNDFGPTRPSASDGDMIKDPRESKAQLPWRVYGFAAARGNIVGRDIFLDGNTFGGSHSVTRKTLTATTEFGYGVQYYNLSFIWRFVTTSPEFEERENFHSFASLTLSYYQDLD
nr:lipid A deacylase LpxR family protein [Bdellovibrio sp. CKG001]